MRSTYLLKEEEEGCLDVFFYFQFIIIIFIIFLFVNIPKDKDS